MAIKKENILSRLLKKFKQYHCAHRYDFLKDITYTVDSLRGTHKVGKGTVFKCRDCGYCTEIQKMNGCITIHEWRAD